MCPFLVYKYQQYDNAYCQIIFKHVDIVHFNSSGWEGLLHVLEQISCEQFLEGKYPVCDMDRENLIGKPVFFQYPCCLDCDIYYRFCYVNGLMILINGCNCLTPTPSKNNPNIQVPLKLNRWNDRPGLHVSRTNIFFLIRPSHTSINQFPSSSTVGPTCW